MKLGHNKSMCVKSIDGRRPVDGVGWKQIVFIAHRTPVIDDMIDRIPQCLFYFRYLFAAAI